MRDRACLVTLHSGHVRSLSEKVLNLKEYKFKEGKRRRKTLPPSDSMNQVYVECDTGPFFGATISYDPPQNSNDYPINVAVEVSVDGRAIDVWALKAGDNVLLEDGCSQKVLERLSFSVKEKENADSNGEISYFGTIDFKFWRGTTTFQGLNVVMKSHTDHDTDFFPDEGLPALAIFTFHYRDKSCMRSEGLLKEDLKQKRSFKTIQNNKSPKIYRKDFDQEFQSTDTLVTFKSAENLGPINRRRVPVLVYDTQGVLLRKLAINFDKNADFSIVHRSFQIITRFLENQCRWKDNPQIEAINHDGLNIQCLKTLEFDTIKEFRIINS